VQDVTPWSSGRYLGTADVSLSETGANAHDAGSAAVALVGGEGLAWAFAREAFFLLLFSFPGWWAREREGGVDVVRGPLLSWGLSGFAWVRAVPRGGFLCYFVSLLLFFAFSLC
jgi:hypothetical protein